MQSQTNKNCPHSHDFSVVNERGERRTRYVLALTAATMVVEIVAGTIYGSMALLADGWHMATHVAAFLITLFTYNYARKHADNPRFAFGTGKVNVLGGFASAVALAVVALVMLMESVGRIITPEAIHFNEAIAVAVLGLVINIISAILLKDDHHHEDDDHDEQDHHHHHDHNLKAAYLHVLADAMTSVLAIVALLCGKFLGWSWLDPLMGIVGAVIITRWAFGLLKQTSPTLLDASIEEDYRLAIRNVIERDSDDVIFDLHVWKVGANHYAAIISLASPKPNSVAYYRELLRDFHRLAHLTIEVNQASGDDAR